MEDNIDIKNPFKTPHSQGFPSHQDGGALYPPPLTTHRLIVVEESHLYPQHLLSHPPISPQLQEERNLILWQRPSVLTLRLYTYMVGGGGGGVLMLFMHAPIRCPPQVEIQLAVGDLQGVMGGGGETSALHSWGFITIIKIINSNNGALHVTVFTLIYFTQLEELWKIFERK